MAQGLVTSYGLTHESIVSKVIATYADVGAGNIAIIYGNSISIHRQSEIYLRILELLQVLVEDGFRAPTLVGDYVFVTTTLESGKIGVSVSEVGAAGIPAETDVSIVYSDTFDNAPASTLNLTTAVESLAEHLIDDVLSAS
jgi:hypothetical protein